MRLNRVRRHILVTPLALALGIVIATCNAGVAAELTIPPRIAPKAIPKEISKETPKATPKDVSVQTGPPNCARWTDDCVSCTRGAEGAPATCSNIGFACQPKAIRCLGAP